MKTFKFSIFLSTCIVGNFTFAQILTDEQIARESIPPEFFKIKTISKDDTFINKDNVGVDYLSERFGAKDGTRYLIALYLLTIGVSSEKSRWAQG